MFVYDYNKKSVNKTLILNYEIIKFIDDLDTDLQALVLLNKLDKIIYVIFRGSDSKLDFYYNSMKKRKKIMNNVSVHSGFFNQLTTNKSCDILINQVQTLLQSFPTYKIHISGHSLGGALATLFGYILSFSTYNYITIVSFASPRVGDKRWKRDFQKRNIKHYRISNRNDIITAFPLILYKHVGENIHLNINNVRFYRNYEYKWYTYTIFKCLSFNDHYCKEYYKYLVNNTW
jgi:hypothetical protein